MSKTEQRMSDMLSDIEWELRHHWCDPRRAAIYVASLKLAFVESIAEALGQKEAQGGHD